MEIKFTDAERLVLCHQLQILSLLDKKNAASYLQQLEVVEQGYELAYGWVLPRLSKAMPSKDSVEVLEILGMFETLKGTFDAQADKAGLDTHDFKFLGFDGNSEIEGRYLGFTAYLIEREGKFQDLKDTAERFNSHMPMLDTYRRMLAAWKQSPDQHNLTRDDLVRIVAERVHPSRRTP